MRVLVDTSVWSLALRRTTAVHAAAGALADLIREGRVVMVGVVRQEILSGVRDRAAFDRLRDKLRAFPDEPLEAADYARAAECFNRCRAKGLQGSNTDFLLCAIAERRGLPVFTTDADFERYRRHVPILRYAMPPAR